MAEKPAPKAEHFDVLIVGAGISGIGASYHMTKQMPEKSFVVLEMQETFGGTWLTHKYPGSRSDSDLFTFGYRFKYWPGPPIAQRHEILDYLKEVIDDNALGRHIRYRHKILNASWSSKENLWTVEAINLETNEPRLFTCNFLWMCQGYYNHDAGYTPDFKGASSFKGRIVHPQKWPDDLDYTGKRVIVIGSGATSATVIPALAKKAAHVVMLQRSPTYYATGRNADAMADALRELDVDKDWIHEIMRKKYLHDHGLGNTRAFSEPEIYRDELLANVRTQLGPDYPVDKHFTPRHLPLRQRTCFVPDSDLFKTIREGKASVVTDEIEAFEENGIRTKSGELIEADIVVTATGFNILPLGGATFTVDGSPRNFGDSIAYRGMMFTGLPNLVWVFGYARWAWTLRVDLVADFVCRLLKDMDRRGVKKVEVALGEAEKDMAILPFFRDDDFNPGYMKRGMHNFPKQGDRPEWRHTQNYMLDKDELPSVDLNERAFIYS